MGTRRSGGILKDCRPAEAGRGVEPRCLAWKEATGGVVGPSSQGRAGVRRWVRAAAVRVSIACRRASGSVRWASHQVPSSRSAGRLSGSASRIDDSSRRLSCWCSGRLRSQAACRSRETESGSDDDSRRSAMSSARRSWTMPPEMSCSTARRTGADGPSVVQGIDGRVQFTGPEVGQSQRDLGVAPVVGGGVRQGSPGQKNRRDGQ